MDAGEGLKLVGVVGAMGLGGWAFIEGAAWLSREWSRMIERWPSDESDERDLAAEAVVPEYAAAKRACGCRSCRNRSQEPCSDFDGD